MIPLNLRIVFFNFSLTFKPFTIRAQYCNDLSFIHLTSGSVDNDVIRTDLAEREVERAGLRDSSSGV